MSSHSITISDEGLTLIHSSDMIGQLDGPYRWLCGSHKTDCGHSLQFISNHALYSELSRSEDDKSMLILDTNGELLLRDDFHHRELVYWEIAGGGVATSMDGPRFAVALEKGKGGIAALDIAPHYSASRVIVYDLTSRRSVYTLDAKRAGIKGISSFALSPDGSLLALINQDGILEIYRLPNGSSSQ
jgi:hypothetical protein